MVFPGRSYRTSAFLSLRIWGMLTSALLATTPLASFAELGPAPARDERRVEAPLSHPEPWRTIQLDGVPLTSARHNESGIHFQVLKSSSPLLFVLEKPTPVQALEWSGRALGLPHGVTGIDDEWQKDDFAMRVGVVLTGDGGPSWLERLFAPRWLKDLAESFPDAPFQRLELLVLAQKIPPGTRRSHPDSKYWEEEVVGNLPVPGRFAVRHEFKAVPTAVAMFVQADGDGTHSTYQIQLDRLAIITTAEPITKRAVASPVNEASAASAGSLLNQ